LFRATFVQIEKVKKAKQSDRHWYDDKLMGHESLFALDNVHGFYFVLVVNGAVAKPDGTSKIGLFTTSSGVVQEKTILLQQDL
jgi:hypothetical protein